MKKRYSHIRIETKKVATDALNGTSRAPIMSEPELTNDDVLDLLSAGLDPSVVVAKIKSSPCAFRTSIDDLKKLKTQSIPDSVIKAMLSSRT